jgi:hypothetical protein
VTETADSAKLSFERSFKYVEDGIVKIIVHGGLLSIAQEQDGSNEVGLSTNSN